MFKVLGKKRIDDLKKLNFPIHEHHIFLHKCKLP